MFPLRPSASNKFPVLSKASPSLPSTFVVKMLLVPSGTNSAMQGLLGPLAPPVTNRFCACAVEESSMTDPAQRAVPTVRIVKAKGVGKVAGEVDDHELHEGDTKGTKRSRI